jgi:hypothetical protein
MNCSFDDFPPVDDHVISTIVPGVYPSIDDA